jgi:tetratricopeptide (TPR) repeat protein
MPLAGASSGRYVRLLSIILLFLLSNVVAGSWSQATDEALERLNIGRRLLAEGKPREALSWIDHSFRIKPRWETLLERGKVWLALGRFDLALDDFTVATQWNPEHPEGWRLRAKAWLKLGNLEAADSDCSRAISLRPSYVLAWLERAAIRRRRKNLREALQDVEQAMELEPQSAQPYFVRALVRADIGDWQGAESDWNLFLARHPDHASARLHRAVARIQFSDFAGASQDIEVAQRQLPDDAQVYLVRSRLFEALKNYAQAEYDISVALRQSQGAERAEYLLRRARIRLAWGKQEEALADLQESLSLDPTLTGQAYQLLQSPAQ